MKTTTRRSSRFWPTVIGLLLISLLVIGSIVVVRRGQRQSQPRLNYSLVTAQRGPLSATVNAAGSIQPRQVRNLSFTTSGIVAEVLVEIGDQVAPDDPLVRLDDRELELRVRQAEAALAQARANYEKLLSGALPAEQAQAEAQLAQARAQLRQVEGGVTPQDLQSARAQVEQAQANLSRLLAGPQTEELDQARAQLAQAEANRQSQRDSLAAAKVRAESQLEQAANTLRNAQDEYSRIYWQNRELERLPGQLPQEFRDREAAALRAVQNAEEGLSQARLALEQARKNEQSGLAAADAQVANTQAGLDRLLAGAQSDQLAAARAQLAQAEANLSKLQGDQRSGSLAAAQAGVASAEANLARISAPARREDLAAAQAQVMSAEAALEQARLALERATLYAPIAGTVAEINLQADELLTTARPAVVLADLSGFYVDIIIDEIDVAQIAPGQAVQLDLDALPDLGLNGTVVRINPLSTPGATVTSYAVRIETRAVSPRIRPGMSANADIIVATRENALTVPRRAVRAEQGRFFVDLPVDQSLCMVDRTDWPVEVETRPVEVRTGLSNDLRIEIVDGVIDETSCLYVAGLDARLDPLSGPPSRVRN